MIINTYGHQVSPHHNMAKTKQSGKSTGDSNPQGLASFPMASFPRTIKVAIAPCDGGFRIETVPVEAIDQFFGDVLGEPLPHQRALVPLRDKHLLIVDRHKACISE